MKTEIGKWSACLTTDPVPHVGPFGLRQIRRPRLSLLVVLAGLLAAGCLLPQAALAQASNGVLREVWLNIGGNAVSDLTNNANFPNNPSLETLQPTFEAPTDWADNYGTRMRAWVLPPTTGTYYFAIRSDDNSALYLSTDDQPANKVLLTQELGCCNAYESHVSAGIYLIAGQRYYIEALQKEGGGGDYVSVRWQLPDGTIEAPIPNNRLLAYGLGPPIITQQPTNVTVVEGNSATFSVTLAHMLGTVFQWQRNGTNIPGANNNSYSLGPVMLADSGSTFRCAITNAYGGTNTTSATLTVQPDTTRPTLTTVGNLGERQVVFVGFSEPVEAATATNALNYLINGSITVSAAVFGADTRTIILTTSPLTPDQTYTLTVNNVRDRATTPNTILPNSQMTFALTIRPLDVSYLSLPREPLGPSSRRHGVVISEVMYHPTNRTDGRNLEFVEIFNSQPWFEEMGGWRLSGAIDYTFPSNTVLAARSFLVVAANPTDFRAVYSFTNVFGPFLGSNGLQNSSGTLRLRNSRDAVLFEMSYNGNPPYPASADGGGHSLVLARPSYGESDARAWAASDLIGGNPGMGDTNTLHAQRTVLINELLAHTDPPQVDFIELYNYGNASVSVAGCVLTDDPLTNKFIIPSNTVIQARSFLTFTETQLCFALSAAGEKVFFKNSTGTRIIDAVSFDAQENGVSFGRYPDGGPTFSRLATPTLGTNNAALRIEPVVINEIMFDPISSDSDDEYIELYNQSTNAVNLGGWRLRDGVSFNIPSGTTLAAGAYLVIAKNAARLRTNYLHLTTVNCLGDYSGTLANGGERIELNKPDQLVSTNALGQPETNTIHIAVDEVTYGAGGRWGQWAAGGGSSLELRDARSDRRLAPNWADSDETAKSPWVTVEAAGVVDNDYAGAYQLHITLQGPGECLLDNVEVIPSGSTNLIANGAFETDASGWTFQGNHNQTSWQSGEGYLSVNSLHLRAAGRGDTGANRVRVQLPYTISSGTTVTLRAKARWLKGNPNLLLRLRGNGLEVPGILVATKNLGTPALPNSRAANAGPAITEVRHDPPLPAASQTVLILARVNDPDGLAYLAVNYRLDPSTNYTTVAMTNNGAGLYSALLPGQASGTTAAFYIQSLDSGKPAVASTRFPNDAPIRECVVRWGDTASSPGNGSLGVYHFWITQTNIDKWVAEEKMSNNPKDTTFIYGSSRVIYNVGAMFHGSPYHSPGYNSPVGNACDYDMEFPDDDRLLGQVGVGMFMPGNGGGDGTAQAELHAYWFGGQFGISHNYHRPVFLYFNGQQRNNLFYDAQQPNGDYVSQWFPDDPDGDLHKVQFGFEFGDQAYGASEPNYNIVGADLNRYTTTGGVFKQARYRQTWPLRSASPSEQNNYTNIFALVNASQTTAALGSDAYTVVLTNATDVETWYKVHVIQHLIVNGDSFSYGQGQNAFAYKPQHDTWKLLLWDVDFAFGGNASDGTWFSPYDPARGPRSDHPPFARIYWQTLIEAANGMMTSARSDTILDARYNGMIAGGASVGDPSGIKNFIVTRRSLLLSYIAANQSSFAITSNSGADFTTNRNLITLTGTAPLEVRIILINGVAYPLTWTSVNTWLIRLPLTNGVNTLQITGVDPKGTPVSGVSATMHITYTGVDELPQGKVVINEIMYNPAAANASYVEIYNSSVSNVFDMSGWRLNGIDFTFPNGMIIEPGAYLILAKDQTVFNATYGATLSVAGEFAGSLDNGGETLTLIKPGVTPDQDVIIDQVTYDNTAPWPTDADGGGSSLQLIDPTQDNNRVGNWTSVPTNAPPPPMQWQYVTATGNGSSSLLYVYLQTAGDVYIDDLKIVPGSVPEVGVNAVQNGDFESTFPGPWTVSANHSGSGISTAITHSGNASLHVVASTGGTTKDSSIWQTCSPALVSGQTYTLSFWYLQSTNGGPLTVRLSGSGISANVTIAPPGGTNAARYTPGAVNSARTTLPAFPTVWLNEVLATNFFLGTNGITDRFGDRDPWVELYNGGTNSLSLSNCYLANNYTNLAQWAFPSNAVIAPKGFLLVWLDGEPGDSATNEFHANFRAAPAIGSVVLSRGTNATSILDYLNYNIPTPGRTYGSFPDGAVSGRRNFGITTPGATNNPTYPPINVFINEWMADNKNTLTDPADNDYEDWFELYNPGTSTVDLSGYYLSDTLTNTTQWQVPDGTIIPALGYLLVWADGETGQNSPSRPDLHASFSLAKSGEAIALFAPDGTLIDGVTFGAQTSDVSQGRFPDGSASIQFMTNATPRAANLVPSANTPPTLAFIGSKNVPEGTLLAFTAVATDSNVPAQVLTYSLDAGAPTGAVINASNGVFNWTPSEAQGPGVYPVSIIVSDSGTPSMSATQTVSIAVSEVNSAPVLATILSQTVNEGGLLTITNSATDPDSGTTVFTFSLDPGAPTNMTIVASNGLIQWTPTEAQGPGSYNITVRVTDNGDPPLSDTKSFTVWVNELNVPPQLSLPTNYWITDPGTQVSFTALASDSDLPPPSLIFSLEPGAPSGANINPSSGLFTWTPTLAESPSTNTITATVSDGFATASRGFTVRVNDRKPPTIIFWTNAVLNANSNGQALMSNMTGTNYIIAVDSGGLVTVTQSVATNTLLVPGTNWVVLGAYDTASNVTYLTNFVHVLDVTPPVVICPGTIFLTKDAGQASKSNVTFTATASDNVAVTNLACVPPSGSTFPLGTNLVTCTATDGSGNTASCTFNVVVITLLIANVSDSVNLRIPDGSPVGLANSVMVSTPIERITDVNVSLVVTGGFNGDLHAYLVHDSGHAILLNRVGKTLANPSGYADAGFNVTFDDQATNSDIHNYRVALSGNPNTPLAGPLTNAWTPDGRDLDPALVLDTSPRTAPLSAFTGLNPNGRWTLFIADLDVVYSSTLISWGLQIFGTNAPPIITAQPQSRTNLAGTTATFNVAATGLSALGYQ